MRWRKSVCDADESGAFKYYFDHGVDKLDEQAQRILAKGYGKLDDDVANLIRNLLHERRWMRGEVARRKMVAQPSTSVHPAKKTPEKGGNGKCAVDRSAKNVKQGAGNGIHGKSGVVRLPCRG